MPAAGRSRSARGAETRERILRAARRVLAERGAERFTTREVAALAGITHGMTHYHFSAKRDLVVALIEQARTDWVEPLQRIAEGGGTAEKRMRRMISWMAEPATVEVMRLHQALYHFALDEGEVRKRLAGEYAAWRQPFADLFGELAEELGLENFDAQNVGEAFASAADGLVQQQSLDPELPTERLLRSLFEQLIANAAQTRKSR